MSKRFFWLIAFNTVFQIHVATAQIMADFDELTPTGNGYWNGSDGSGGFYSGACFFRNSYDTTWGSWMGWAYSSMYDTVTAGFGNQYSAYAEPLPGLNSQFGLSYGKSNGFALPATSGYPGYIDSISIANSTYAALSMRDGDAFSKKFGGTTGNDPDYFKIVFYGFWMGQPTGGSVEFFLADYRSPNNSQDYILKGFHPVYLGSLGTIDSLGFELFSSDTSGQWMNTPAYACFDNIRVMMPTSLSTTNTPDQFTIFPNPATEKILWKTTAQTGSVELYNLQGQLVKREPMLSGNMDVNDLQSGVYVIQKTTTTETFSKQILIQH